MTSAITVIILEEIWKNDLGLPPSLEHNCMHRAEKSC